MKIPKFLFVTTVIAAAFSVACNSLLQSFPTSSFSKQQTDLVNLLPPSDIVMRVNSKRLFNDSIPQLLSFAPEAAVQYNNQIKELQGKSGIDPQVIDEIVVGWTYKSQKPANMNEIDFVALARGNFDSNVLLEKSKQSAKGKIREETIEGKIVYFIDTSAVADKQSGSNQISDKNGIAGAAVADKLKVDQIAMVALDAQTLAFAKPAQIHSVLTNNKAAVNPVLIELLNRHPGAAINLAINSSFQQNLMSSSFSNDAPQMNESLVSLDFDNNGFLMNLATITPKEEDAKKLEESFVKMQTAMKQMLGKATDETSQVLARTFENFKFTRNAAEVQFEAKIPKNDLVKIFKGYAALLTSLITAGKSQSTGTANSLPPTKKSL